MVAEGIHTINHLRHTIHCMNDDPREYPPQAVLGVEIPKAGSPLDIQSTMDQGDITLLLKAYRTTGLPDDLYRMLLMAKVAANAWDGTTPHAYKVWGTAFAGTSAIIFIQDHQDMSMTVGVPACKRCTMAAWTR